MREGILQPDGGHQDGQVDPGIEGVVLSEVYLPEMPSESQMRWWRLPLGQPNTGLLNPELQQDRVQEEHRV